jgi:hypothetical protein
VPCRVVSLSSGEPFADYKASCSKLLVPPPSERLELLRPMDNEGTLPITHVRTSRFSLRRVRRHTANTRDRIVCAVCGVCVVRAMCRVRCDTHRG